MSEENAPREPSPEERRRILIEAARRQVEERPGPSSGSPEGSSGHASLTEEGSGGFSWPPAGAIVGYKIVREIGHGGQGVVYQAVQKSTKRKVAIKVMREGPFAGPADRGRFEREAQVLGQLKHPNIVTIHDTGQAAGSYYFVMEYISGKPLDDYMAGADRSVDETLRLFAKVCDAVNAAHLHGVIHRDLKPGNIRIDAEGQPHVLDFGLAKLANGGTTGLETGTTENKASPPIRTMTGQFIGSLPWASPEQAEAVPSKIDVRTDVYSLGVILYQMLTGRFPYEVVGNMRDVLDRIMKAEPARPSTIRRQINDEVETIVLKCLSKQRERRYQTAGVLADDIKRYLASEPIEAKRDSGWYVLRKSLRRYRWQTGAVGAIAMMLVILAVSMSIQSVRLREERDTLRDLARASLQLARSEGRFGDSEVSNDMLSDLAPLCERQILLDPDDVEWHFYLYAVEDGLFRHDYARRDLESAKFHCDVIWREAQRLVKMEPENHKWQRVMAFALERRGQLLYLREQSQEAYDAFKEASGIRETLRGYETADPVIRNERAVLYDWLAKCCEKLDGWEEEEKRHRLAALEILRDLSTAAPDNYEFVIGRAKAANNLATLYMGPRPVADYSTAAPLLDEASEVVNMAQRILRRPTFKETQDLSNAIEANRSIIGMASGADGP